MPTLKAISDLLMISSFFKVSLTKLHLFPTFIIAKTVLLPLISLIRDVNSEFEEGHSLIIKVSPFFTKSKSFKAAAAEREEIPGMVLEMMSG